MMLLSRSLTLAISPQLTAFFTSAVILASSAAVNSFRAKAVDHMAPSSRFAVSREANVRCPAWALLPLPGALLHRGSFLVRESRGLLVDRGGAIGGLLRVLLWAHRNLLK